MKFEGAPVPCHATRIIADLTLGLGKVVHDYLND